MDLLDNIINYNSQLMEKRMMNLNGNLSGGIQQPVNGGIVTPTAKPKSEHFVVFYEEREGTVPGSVIQVQWPSICGIDNLVPQKEYNTGSDISEAIKEQNAMLLLFQEEAKLLKNDGDYTIIPMGNRVFAKIFKPNKDKDKATLETSSNNFFHKELKPQRFIRN